MSIYAIGDLHLSNSTEKPMDIFGWIDHKEKIFKNWRENVEKEDLVLLAGDISWANHLQEAKEDLEEIISLPGKKIIVKGNHDYWWSTLNKMKISYPELDFLQNNSYEYEDYVIAGTRGWTVPGKIELSEQDTKIYNREITRLKLSLENAKKAKKKIIVMMHYPPMNENHESSDVTKLIEQYNVTDVIYGHLHGKESFKAGFCGNKENINYQLVSCDYLDFKLYKLK